MWSRRRYLRLLREAARAQPLQAPAVLAAVSDALACLRTAAPTLSQSLLALAASLLRLGHVEPVLACVLAPPRPATPAPIASVAVVKEDPRWQTRCFWWLKRVSCLRQAQLV